VNVRPRLQFGLGLPTSGPFSEPDAILDLAQRAEGLGFADVWVNDHFQVTTDMARQSPAGSVEAYAGQPPVFFEASRPRRSCLEDFNVSESASAGLVLPLRDPRWLAKQLSSLHALGGRRLAIAPAIGSGVMSSSCYRCRSSDGAS